MEQKKTKRAPKFRSFLFITFWLIIIVMFGGLSVLQATRYSDYRQELEGVQEQLALERRAHQDLLDQMAYYDSDAYIEQLARDQLGYVMPDELVFVNVPELQFGK